MILNTTTQTTSFQEKIRVVSLDVLREAIERMENEMEEQSHFQDCMCEFGRN